jgi:hypothetical protein
MQKHILSALLLLELFAKRHGIQILHFAWKYSAGLATFIMYLQNNDKYNEFMR